MQAQILQFPIMDYVEIKEHNDLTVKVMLEVATPAEKIRCRELDMKLKRKTQ